MSVFEIYNRKKREFKSEYEYSLVRVNDQVLVGDDNEGRACIVLVSSEPQRDSEARKTKELSYACNVEITYQEDNDVKEEICHIIKCYSQNEKDIEMFLKLGETFFVEKEVSINDIVDIFNTLNDFFAKSNKYSKSELQGLYGELYAIYHFRDKLDLCEKWQNKDKMKFDFSISKDTKLEVKTTTLPLRIHHFKHEQLAINLVDIYVLSFKLREDNDGLSLRELMDYCLPLLKQYPQKESRVLKVIYDLREESYLEDMKYLESYTIGNMKIFNAKDIPKFDEETPSNVSDAEYNSDLEGLTGIDEEEIVSLFRLKA